MRIVNSGIDNLNNTGYAVPGDRCRTWTTDSTSTCRWPIPAGQLAVAILDDDYLIDLELSALQAEGRGEVISSPRVITANQKEASIEQGVEIPYQEASSQRRHHHPVQGSRAVADGDAADHAR